MLKFGLAKPNNCNAHSNECEYNFSIGPINWITCTTTNLANVIPESTEAKWGFLVKHIVLLMLVIKTIDVSHSNTNQLKYSPLN